MWLLRAYRTLLRTVASVACVVALAGCGGHAELIINDPPPIAGLTLVPTRVGPEAIEVAWSDDPNVETFTVRRDGFTLAVVITTSLIDASVLIDETYCYQVSGYDKHGFLVAQSETGCITVVR